MALNPERNEAIEETNFINNSPLPSKIIHTHDWNIDESAIVLSICIYLYILTPIGVPYHLMSVSFNSKHDR